MSVKRHLVVMAAGTGGHVIPGLAVATEMQSRGWTVSWLGTTHGLENRLVPPAGLPLDTLAFSGMRGKGWRHSVGGAFRLLGAFAACLRVLRSRRAGAVLGMGGYVCLPGGFAAWLLRKPLVLVNADAAPVGHGALLWFELDDFDAAVNRARSLEATVIEEPHVNRAPQHREMWLRDPDGYVVVIASPDGEAKGS